jgi:zinc transport system substrate-binding protein
MTRFLYLLFLIAAISCVSRKERIEEANKGTPTVAVVNYPLYYFAKKIGGEFITVYFPMIQGDPAYWIPDENTVINFQNADLILDNGAGYASWMEKVSLPSSKMVNTSITFKAQWIATEEGIMHSHGAEGEHVHKGTAFTTWLNFKFAEQQAESVHQALRDLLPDYSEELDKNFNQVNNDLIDLDKRMEAITLRLNHQLLIASHPVYQYLVQGYGLNLFSLHWEPDQLPTKEQWDALAHIIKDSNARIMIWEDVPNHEIIDKLNDLGIYIAVFNTCANSPGGGDFMSMMNENLLQLEKVINML